MSRPIKLLHVIVVIIRSPRRSHHTLYSIMKRAIVRRPLSGIVINRLCLLWPFVVYVFQVSTTDPLYSSTTPPNSTQLPPTSSSTACLRPSSALVQPLSTPNSVDPHYIVLPDTSSKTTSVADPPSACPRLSVSLSFSGFKSPSVSPLQWLI